MNLGGIDLFSLVNFLQMGDVWRRVRSWMGGGKLPHMPQQGDQPQAEPKDVAANKDMADEAHELHALLKAISSKAEKTGIYYEIQSDEFWIMQAIWTRLPKGAVRKLFDTFATGVVSKRHNETTGYTDHPPGEDGKPRKPTPIKEEYVTTGNLMGPELIRGLVWYAREAQESPEVPDAPPGTHAKMKGILYVVEMLKTSQLLRNLSDEADEKVTKAAAWTAKQAAAGDTMLHYGMLYWKLGWQESQRVWNSPAAMRYRTKIRQAEKKGSAETVKELNEELQRFLQEAARAIAEAKQRPRRQRYLTALKSWGWIILGIVLLIVLLVLPGLPD